MYELIQDLPYHAFLLAADFFAKSTFLKILRAIPEKIPGGVGGWGGGGKTADDIFFYGWLVRKDFKLYGSLVSDQIKLHGRLVFRCVEGEERLLSNLAKRKR